jgi:ribosome-binding protein aMBF1 (putative translation factor)
VKIEGIRVKSECEYCGGPINGKPKVLAFANFECYFCCTRCNNHDREKHGGRIPSIVELYKEMRKEVKKLLSS